MKKAKPKSKPATKEDILEVFHEVMERLVEALHVELGDLSEDMHLKLDKIDHHIVALHAEIKEIRDLYMFIAKQHLTPELAEKYLAERRKN